jgi:hypothetical protein
MSRRKRRAQSEEANRPREIPMTDLESDGPTPREKVDIHAAGTPGGGTSMGGLAGTNIDDGSPDNADLEDALGSGIHDNEGAEETGGEVPYAGHAGGAVGGSPANSRTEGGLAHRGLSPQTDPRSDSTIGAQGIPKWRRPRTRPAR